MQNRRLALSIFVVIITNFLSPVVSLEQGFVYCPAYPCECESDNGALVVNCQYLYLTRLPKFLAFDGRIRTLSLRQNSIRQLPASAFQGLHVKSLDLTENVITHVHRDAFEGLEDSLEELHLQVYAMEGVPSAALKGLKKLKVLRINGCKANILNSSTFEGLEGLEELYLQGCRIRKIEVGGLSSLKHLQVLSLAANALTTHALAEVAKLYELRKLVLSQNLLTHLPDQVFDHLLHLRHLDLSKNQMTHVEVDALKPLHLTLEALKLHHNHLTKDVFLALHNLRNLRQLVLSSNNITSIPIGVFNNHEFLSHLELSDNGITELDKQALKGTEKHLQILKLNGNPVSILRDNIFEDHSRLRQLSLDNTELGGTLREGMFHGIGKSLRKLSVSGANLTTMDLLALSSVFALEDLVLSQNIIMDIPEGVFTRLHNLVKLDLSQNSIQALPDSAFRGLETSLESIDLHANVLQTISSCVFEGFQRLEEIRLRNNPLVCDCRLAWLYNWLQMTLPEYHRTLLEWRCVRPEALARRLFGSLFITDLQCPTNISMVRPVCQFNTSADVLVFEEDVQAISKVEQSPLLPLDLMGTFPSVNLRLRDRGTLLVLWNTTTTTPISGFRLVLRRSNDSVAEADMTFTAEVTRYLFSGLLDDFSYLACVTVLGQEMLPLGRDCAEITTSSGNESAVGADDTKIPHPETSLHLPVSFTTLLWSYITGCIIASTLCAILAVLIRRRRRHCRSRMQRQRAQNKYVSSSDSGSGFNPGYSAWAGPRYSLPSSAGTSSCYFNNTPSEGSCDNGDVGVADGGDGDGLVITINGIDNNHSVVDRMGEEEEDERGVRMEDNGGDSSLSRGVMLGKGDYGGSLARGGVFGEGEGSLGRGVGVGVRRGDGKVFGGGSGVFGRGSGMLGGGGGDGQRSGFSAGSQGRCSTVSSFRRHLPANYIVTNTDKGDDYFFYF